MMNSPIIEFDVHGRCGCGYSEKGGSGRNCRLQDPGDPRIQWRYPDPLSYPGRVQLWTGTEGKAHHNGRK